jgi:regulator of sigma E protease
MTQSPGILLMVLGFLLMIGPLVFVHEMGHYWAGRLFGVKIDGFSIGMGKELAGWTDRRGTRWKLSALPIGGYVKFAGDMGPASNPDPAWVRLPPEEKARTLAGRPVWQRFIVVAAGPITNFVTAIAIFAVFFAVTGVPHTPARIADVIPGSAAAKAGMKPGDEITRIAGRPVDRFETVMELVALRPDQRLAIDIVRGGQPLHLSAVTSGVVETDPAGNSFRRGLLGIRPGAEVVTRPGIVGTIGAAIDRTGGVIRTMVDVIGQIMGGRRPASELGGPLRIAQYSGEAVSFGWLPFIQLMALISVNLGFVNLLPIPLLDGGHLFFYTLEALRRRPVPAQAQEWAFRSGLALLLAFMLFVTVNDLASFGLWRRLAGLIG